VTSLGTVQDKWTCPECGRRFARANQHHVYDRTSVEDHLLRKPQHVIELYQYFVALVEACRPFDYAPIRRQIGFQGRSRIFAAVRLTSKGLEGYLDLARRIDRVPFKQVAKFSKRPFVHHFEIVLVDEMDEEFAGWVRESYSVGEGLPDFG
jgi:Domain of unknown function (DUF5655)